MADCDPYDFFYGRQQAIAARDKAEGSLKRASAEADSLELMLGHMCLVRGSAVCPLDAGSGCAPPCTGESHHCRICGFRAAVETVCSLAVSPLPQEYGRVRDLAVELLPSHPDRDLLLETGHLDPWLQQCISALCSPAGAAAPPDAASAQPPGAEPPACPPPPRPPAAGHHSMPQLRAAQRCVSTPLLHAASMPARPTHVPRPAAATPPPASFSIPASASGQPPQAAPPPAPAAPASLPAELTTLAAALLSGVAPGQTDRLPGASPSGASAAAAQVPTNLLSRPALCSPAHVAALAAAPSSSHLPGPSSAAAAVPRSPAVSPPPSFLQQLPILSAAADGAASPSADVSSRTMAGGPGDASPATNGGGSGVSSPNKRKRGAEQVRVGDVQVGMVGKSCIAPCST